MFNGIKIKKEYLPYPDKSLEIKNNKDEDLIIFGRNGSGKTTIAREVFECQSSDRSESESYFLSSEGRRYTLSDSEKLYVYGFDYFINFNTSRPVIVSSDKIEDLQFKIDNTNKEINAIAQGLARFGGSNSKPNETLARRLYSLGIKGASFNARTKESFFRGELAFLKELCESSLYKNLSEHKNVSSSSEQMINLQYFQNNYSDEQVKTIKVLSEYPGIFELQNKVEKWDEDLQEWNSELDKLSANIRLTKEYLKNLNQELSLIFFDKERIKFTLENSKNIYEVKSRNKIVENLAQLSTAEQNIINLVFFFLKIHFDIDKIKSDANEEPQITILLDDPISSTDFDNKIGIYSFLRNQIQRLGEKVDLKCIVLTHDEEVFYHFDKTLNDLGRSRETFELVREKGLIPINSENNFYSTYLWNVFYFAVGQKDELNSYIGNIMRKVLEAYSTFNYAIGMEKLSTDEEILKKISNDRRNFFERNMYRLLLNSESHTANSFKKTANQSVSLFDIEEKKKTAKIVISLLYSLDDLHLKKHFIFYAKQHEELKNYKEFKKELDRIDKDISRFETDLKNKQSVPAEYNLNIEKTEKQISEKKAERNGLINKNEKLYDILLINKDADSWWENTESEIQKWLEMNF